MSIENGVVTYSTLGSCVIRDIFRIADKEKHFGKVRNIGFISPISMFSKISVPCGELKQQITSCTASGFEKRNILLDIDGRIFDYLAEEISEYIIIDLADIRLNLMTAADEIVSIRNNYVESMLTKKYLSKCGYAFKRVIDIDQSLLLDYLDRFCDEILKWWNPPKIILIESYPVRMFQDRFKKIDKNGYFEDSYMFDHDYTRVFRLSYKHVKDRLQCRCVSMPDMQYVLADFAHAWGPSPFHYTDKVYEYLYDQICSIVFQNYSSQKEKILKQIKYEYYSAIDRVHNSANQEQCPLSKEMIRCLSTESFTEYIAYLKDLKNCIVIFAVKDTLGSYFNNEMQQRMMDLGLVENFIRQHGSGYIAVLKDGIVIHEKLNKTDGYDYFIDTIDYINLFIVSKAYKYGNSASICVNGEEYAVNKRGVNIVVFDMNRQKVVDSVAFDTHVPKVTCTRNTSILSTDDAVRIDIYNLTNRLNSLYKTMEEKL